MWYNFLDFELYGIGAFLSLVGLICSFTAGGAFARVGAVISGLAVVGLFLDRFIFKRLSWEASFAIKAVSDLILAFIFIFTFKYYWLIFIIVPIHLFYNHLRLKSSINYLITILFIWFSVSAVLPYFNIYDFVVFTLLLLLEFYFMAIFFKEQKLWNV